LIRAVFFDVGGTLIHPHPSVGEIYSRVAAKHGVDKAGDVLNLRFNDAWKRQKTLGQTIEKEWWRNVVSDVFSDCTFADKNRFFDDLFEAFRNPAVWEIYPDVKETLTELGRRKLRLAVASNWDLRLPALLNDLGLAPFFERQFISFAVGFAKPDPRFFTHALSEMGVLGLEAIHIGDDLEEDVRAAESAGMRAYHIDRSKKPLNSRSLVDLSEVLSRV
jgi:putative hydrolase of the HAD superfamily